MAEAALEHPTRLSRWLTLMASLRHPKTGYVLLFGFASGLPYALLLGTLYAWLTDAKVDVETMGVFSLIGLAYAFKFLWSPVLDRVDLPGLRKLGKRKQARRDLRPDWLGEGEVDPSRVLSWSHTQIVLSVPPGIGPARVARAPRAVARPLADAHRFLGAVASCRRPAGA
jgi:hypothetical protein